ncbi:MAG: hypothetical protein HOV80_07740 [Polyangiaceae bacterium]|nr:hypothetical protein [Polyangiaceae bacterium]
MLEIEIEGLDELKARWDRERANIQAGLERAVEAVVIYGSMAAKADAPVETGRLKDSLEGVVTRSSSTSAEGVVRARVKHMRFVIEGTEPHVIEPKRKKALKFNGAGGIVFARRVNHPGTRPNDFLADARREAEETLRRELQQTVDAACARMNRT